jgi:N-acetyl-alpha-D-glucosaminyl L-malate synthase BshA
MNIAILSYHRIGGSGIVAYETGRAMAEKGHNVHFIGLEPPFRLRDNFISNIHFHKVWVHEYPVFNYPPYTLALASQLSEIINEFEIDVIHSHYALPHAAAALFAKEISQKPVKCVTTLHGTDITVVGAHPSMKNVTKYAILKSDSVTAVSNYLKTKTEKEFGIKKGKIKTIYNFVNNEMFNPKLANSSLISNKNKTIIIHLSNLRPVKEPLDVIKIFAKVCKQETKKQPELWVVGEGPLKPEMQLLAKQLKINDKVKFLGIKNIIGPILASADIFLLTSRQESFGLSLLESLSCGVPAVATNSGGIPELIENEKTGLLFEQGNIEEGAQKVLQLINNNKLYNKLKENGLHLANTKFSREKIISQYEEIY